AILNRPMPSHLIRNDSQPCSFVSAASGPCEVARREGAVMKAIDDRHSERKPPFDPKVFLDTENGDRIISKYLKDQTVFSQGGLADAVFYIQKGKVKITVVSDRES